MNVQEPSDILRQISDEIEARTGYKTFHHVSQPTPYSLRIVVCGGEVVGSWTAAGARLNQVREAVAAGTWDHWNCRTCAASFRCESDRDIHEEVNAHAPVSA